MCAFENEELVEEQETKTFTCIKCKEQIEYSEFFKHDDPAFDYSFYSLEHCPNAVGVEIVSGVSLCEWCVPVMYHGMEKRENV